MRKIMMVLAAAGLLAVGAGTASAQGMDVRIGVGGPGHHRMTRAHGRPVVERRIIERRVRPAPRRTVCRTVIRERVRPNGVVVRRPTEVCRRVY